MNDDLNRLSAELGAAPPAADARAKARHLVRAMENFDRLQETAAAARQTNMRPTWGARLSQGAHWMLHGISSRAGLAATTGLVTLSVGLVLILPQMEQRLTPPATLPLPAVATASDKSEAPVEAPREIAEAADVAVPRPEPSIEPSIAPQSFIAEPAPVIGTVAPPASALKLRKSAPEAAPGRLQQPDTEAFTNTDPNPVKIVTQEPVSTFSIDVDTASYAVVRSSLSHGMLPPRGAVRAEEMINYFPYSYPVPEPGTAPFRPTITVAPSPWNPGTELVHIAIQGALPAIGERPPLNLVFLIDTSGSMQSADKLPLLKQSFRLMLSQLHAGDEVAIVAYAGSAGQVLAPTAAGDRATILAALDRLQAGGSTAGQAGLQQAYAVAESMAAEGEVNRVILATDGDFNVGLSDPGALKTYIAGKRKTGTYLSVLGFGRGNLDDATMQALAQNGNGQAAYIDTLAEAQKVLVDQLTGALYPIADDVKIQVEFNPARVAEYRLIGYETRILAREDFNNDKVDAGEIGAGRSVTAIYEVTPTGSPAVLNDALRYQAETAPEGRTDELGFLRLRYKAPGETSSHLIEVPIPAAPGEAGPEARFSFAIAGFAQLLTGGKYLGDWGYGDAIALANSARGDDRFGYRAGAITLMRLAQSLSRD